MTNKITKTMYNGEVEITFYPDSHRYKKAGEKSYLISVTSATGMIDKSRVLIPWAVNLTTDYIREKMRDIVEVSKETLDLWLFEAETAHQRKKEEAASIGSQVHEWAENFTAMKLEGAETPELHDEMAEEVILGINAFLDWYNSNEVVFHASERMLYSLAHEYVGLTDAIATINGKKYIVDYKTSKGVYNEMGYQVAAYAKAYEEETGDTLDGAMIIKFGKEDGQFEVKEYSREEVQKNYETFLACLAIKKREKELSSQRYADSKTA